MTKSPHPWLAHLSTDNDDGPPDVGDPRDLVQPEIARGGMTTCDPEAWARAINEAARAAGERRGEWRGEWPSWTVLGCMRDADRFGLSMEMAIARCLDPEVAFRASTFGVSAHEGAHHVVAAVLWQHWIYGERFWAWWQGRQKPSLIDEVRRGKIVERDGDRVRVVREPTPSTNAHGIDVSAIRVGDYVRKREGQWAQVAHLWRRGSLHARLDSGAGIHTYFNHPDDVFDHRPAPRIVLPDGREVVPERMWRLDGRARADIDGSAWGATEDGRWFEVSNVPWCPQNVARWERLWPPLDVVPA